MNNEMGVLNSVLPFLIKNIWIVKASMPEKLNNNENIKPTKEFWNTRINPYKTKNMRNRCMIMNPFTPPGNLNKSHSFQYAESISWFINSTELIK